MARQYRKWTSEPKNREILGILGDAPDYRLNPGSITIDGRTFGAWFDCAPEWLEHDAHILGQSIEIDGKIHACDKWIGNHEFCTVLEAADYGSTAPESGKKWVKVYTYELGERDCWCCDPKPDPTCKLCDGDGNLYLGTMVGVVYRSKRPTWG